MGGARNRRLAVTAWLALLGLAATIVGGHDAVSGTEVNARLFGTLVLGAGIILIVGAEGLRGRRPAGHALATIAAYLGVALGGLIFLAQVVNDEPDRRLVIWAAIILLSAAAVREIRVEIPDEERSKGIWSQLPVLKSAISLGLLISAAQFWYTSIYVPTTAPASLTLEPEIEVSPTRGGQLAKGTVKIRNTSGTRVNVLASTLDISGERLIPARLRHEAFKKAIRKTYRGAALSADRYTESDEYTTVAHGPLVPDGTYFEPGEVVTVPVLTRIPKGRFNALHLQAWLAVARGRVLAVETEESEIRPSEDRVVVVTAVPEAGWLRSLTRADRFVRTTYLSDPEAGFPEVIFTPGRRSEPSSDLDERLKRFYGASEAEGRAVISLPVR